MKKKLALLRQRLLHISGREPLSRMSLVVIIALDIFVVHIIFTGLHEHTRLLVSAEEYMPAQCRQALLENSWAGGREIDNLQSLVLDSDNAYSYDYRDVLDAGERHKAHPACASFLAAAHRMKDDGRLLAALRDRADAQNKREQLLSAFQQAKAVHETNLLEKTAGSQGGQSTAATATLSRDLAAEIDAVNHSLRQYDDSISADPAVATLMQELRGTDRQAIREDLRQFSFWYPLKEFAWQVLFLLPLCAFFFLWNARSIRRDSNLQILLSSHLLVISFIPVLFKALELLLDILPHRLLESLYQFLVSLQIIAVWHYLIILLAIVAGLGAIYLIQKKVFSPEKIMLKRLMKGACQSCARKLPQGAAACPFCGAQQMRECAYCRTATYRAGRYCVNCGATAVPEDVSMDERTNIS